MEGNSGLCKLLLEQFDYAGASAIALLMLVSSFLLLFLVNFGQWWSTRAQRRET
jgi:sulfate/thiosulfate transport system permease protein